MVTFNQIHNNRKLFLKEFKEDDHAVFIGNNNIVISAPHGVSQVRLGKLKFQEIGSLAFALCLAKTTNSYLIAKTKNNNDDANFDEKSKYKNSLCELVKNNNIKYIIDFHGLKAERECDINLGIHLGKNIENNIKAFERLDTMLEKGGFKVNIDQPFMGNSNTIAGSMKNKFSHLWTLQVEINCGITNNIKNFDKFNKLMLIFTKWMKTLF